MNVEQQGTEDEQIEMALRHFRASVQAWSEQEFAKPRVIRRSQWAGVWRLLASPVLGWTMGAAVLTTGVGIPVTVHHQRQLEVAREAAQREQQKLKQEDAQRQAALAMNDEELMSHVDRDIAQGAPDAMEPLASLMNDSVEQ